MTRRRCHIAYVCADRGVPVGGFKGASAHLAELTRALRACGADVQIIAARAADGVDERSLTTPVIDVGADRAMRQLRQLAFDGARSSQQRTRATEIYALLLNQGMTHELERLHRRWGIDAVYERYSLWGHAAAVFAQSARVPYLLEVNAPLRVEQRRYRGLANDLAAADLETLPFRIADHVIVPSAALRPYVVGRGARSAGVRVMPNAADPSSYQPRSGRTSPDAPFVVGFLGTLKPWHGVEDLVRAFRGLHRRFSGYRLLLAGDGPLRAPLTRMVRDLGIRDAVEFAGEVEHRKVPALLARMDVATAPYPRLAGFYFSPIKLFEYMAAGVPVVASDIGQIGEILGDRRTALLHRPGSVTEMARAIDTLRENPELAARLARAARRLVTSRYTWRRNAERVLALIERQRRRERAHAARERTSRGSR